MTKSDPEGGAENELSNLKKEISRLCKEVKRLRRTLVGSMEDPEGLLVTVRDNRMEIQRIQREKETGALVRGEEYSKLVTRVETLEIWRSKLRWVLIGLGVGTGIGAADTLFGALISIVRGTVGGIP